MCAVTTCAVILVFFPVLNMSGLAGRIFGPLVMAAVGLLIALGIGALFLLSESFLPELREGNITVHMTAVPGTSLQESLRLGNHITEALLKIPSVQSVSQRAGRAELGTDTMGTHESEIDVNMKAINGKQVREAQAGIRETLSQFPGPILTSNSFLTERINETLSGYRTPVVVNVVGNELDQLDQEAAEIVRALSSVRGSAQVQVQSPPGMPQIVVRLRKEDVARWGFDPVAVLDVIRTAYGSDIVGQVYEGNRVFDVSVVLAPSNRPRGSEIGALPLRSPDGNYVTLDRLADIYESSARYVILHQGARRVQTITCNVQGRAVDTFVNEAQNRISRLSLPKDTYVEFSGTAAAQAQSRRDLLLDSLLAGLGIVLLLSVVMGNYRNLLLVLLNLPFALVGGVLAALITGGNLSLGSLVGFVTLFGITLRNSIMLISHYEHLVEVEGMGWGLDTMLCGASERLAPILMTALVTGLGLLPLAIGSGDPGREIEGPMAIVILGGLATSTLLNLLVLPALALRYGNFQNATPVRFMNRESQ